jgi:multidrug efflux pump subunit AcrB
MIHFLIRRPIAVTMTFIAILVLGIFAIKYIPVSLMPDIDIPEITVQVSNPNTTAREMENTVVQVLRRQLMQVSHLADISSECRDENGVVHLKFDYGADIDYAFIEVNEKIDRVMNYLPRTIARPKVIKANATDIPVFYLNLSLKKAKEKEEAKEKAEAEAEVKSSSVQTAQPSNSEASNNQTLKQRSLQPSNIQVSNISPTDDESSDLFPVSQKFAELSNFASRVISKRIEQLPEVAMVDISGTVNSELLVLPDYEKLESLGITQTALENSIKNNNIRLGNLLIRDGQYQYNIRFSSTIQDKRDLEEIYLKVNNRLFQLKDVAAIVEHPQKQKGMVIHNGEDAVIFAVIKQSDARMSDLKKKLNNLIVNFEKDYPEIQLDITRNQTTLLDYSIGNLQQDLMWGALLAFLVMFFFLKDFRAPLLVGITIPTSLVVSLLFFYLLGISINVVSLSGIILGVGMTVDNSIIVIDNITQHRQRLRSGSRSNLTDIENLETACSSGTNEVFGPLLSSSLTNSSVFLPLIFISGIAGAMFYDQAMAVTIGLLVSLGVSATLLPVYYRLMYRKEKSGFELKFLKRINLLNFEFLYMSGLRFVMRNQKTSLILILSFLAGGYLLFLDLEKTRLPKIDKDEMMISIDWNERIHLKENKIRTMQLISHLNDRLEQNTCLIGEQQFLMDKNSTASSSEALIYLKVKHPDMLKETIGEAFEYLNQTFPSCIVGQHDADNIFNVIFGSEEKPLTARLRAVKDYGPQQVLYLQTVLDKIRMAVPDKEIESLPLSEYTLLRTDPAKLLLYDVSFNDVYSRLKTAFNENQVILISDNQSFVPVVLGGKSLDIRSVINALLIRNRKNEMIPVRDLISETKGQDLKQIVAGKEGEYYPVHFDIQDKEATELIEKLEKVVREDRNFEIGLSGSIFSNRELTGELTIILLISLALLYFILTSQFESLSLPLIVLMEVPVDLFGAFLALKLGGSGINLMSLIGIVVMSGIVINDSILKVETMNQLYKQGMPLMRAIVEAGHRRLLSILMTTLTAILALLPILFTSGLGADLQKPLALAVIGSMILGTFVSLYFVPLCFYYLKKGKKGLRLRV